MAPHVLAASGGCITGATNASFSKPGIITHDLSSLSAKQQAAVEKLCRLISIAKEADPTIGNSAKFGVLAEAVEKHTGFSRTELISLVKNEIRVQNTKNMMRKFCSDLVKVDNIRCLDSNRYIEIIQPDSKFVVGDIHEVVGELGSRACFKCLHDVRMAGS